MSEHIKFVKFSGFVEPVDDAIHRLRNLGGAVLENAMTNSTFVSDWEFLHRYLGEVIVFMDAVKLLRTQELLRDKRIIQMCNKGVAIADDTGCDNCSIVMSDGGSRHERDDLVGLFEAIKNDVLSKNDE